VLTIGTIHSQSFDRLKPLIDVEGDYKVTHDAEEMIKQRYHQREAEEASIKSELERNSTASPLSELPMLI